MKFVVNVILGTILVVIINSYLTKKNIIDFIINKFKQLKFFKFILFLTILILGFCLEYSKSYLKELYGYYTYYNLMLSVISVILYYNFVLILFKKND